MTEYFNPRINPRSILIDALMVCEDLQARVTLVSAMRYLAIGEMLEGRTRLRIVAESEAFGSTALMHPNRYI